MLQHTAAPLHQFGKNMIRDSRWRVQGEQALRAREAAPHEIEAARRMQEMRDLMELRRARESENPEETGAYAGMRFTSGLPTTSLNAYDSGMFYDDRVPLPEPTHVYGTNNNHDNVGGGGWDYDDLGGGWDYPQTGATGAYNGLLPTTSGHCSSSRGVSHFMGRNGWKTIRH